MNLSDLAAKGARPIGVLLGFTLGDDEWDRAFAEGLGHALAAFGLPLLGGDTVSAPARVLGLTAIGRAAGPAPSRSGARAGDLLWVSGTIGDAGAGLRGAAERRGLAGADRALPQPAAAARGRRASGADRHGDDGRLGRPADRRQTHGRGERMLRSPSSSMRFRCPKPISRRGGEARLEAATAGDDYELLFAARPDAAPNVLALAEEIGLPFSRIGRFEAGAGLTLTERGAPVPLPETLGFEHG